MKCCVVASAILLGFSCGGRHREVTSAGEAANVPIPLWNGVTGQPDYVIHIRTGSLLDVSLFTTAASHLRREMEEKFRTDYDDVVRALGFDPLYDLTDLFGCGGRLDQSVNSIVLVRYSKKIDFKKLLKGLKQLRRVGEDEELIKLGGRDAFEITGGVAIEYDPYTIAIVKATPADAEHWIKLTARRSSSAKEVKGEIEVVSSDEFFGSTPYATCLYMKGGGGLSKSSDIEVPFGQMIDRFGVEKIVLCLTVSGSLFVMGRATFGSESKADSVGRYLRQLLSSPPGALAFLKDIIGRISSSTTVTVEGKILTVRMEITADVLDALYVILKMYFDTQDDKGSQIKR